MLGREVKDRQSFRNVLLQPIGQFSSLVLVLLHRPGQVSLDGGTVRRIENGTNVGSNFLEQLPAIVGGSLLYAAYHVGYGMAFEEIAFLFWIGVLYAASFRLTRNLFVLWPVFQPMGQLVRLIREGLQLPTIAVLGFVDALALMFVLVWLAERRYQKQQTLEGERTDLAG